MENGVILDHGSRFPLVIDPSGSAIQFLLNKYKDEKIQSTSFLDKAFTKTLAGAVRFGTTLLVRYSLSRAQFLSLMEPYTNSFPLVA